MEPRQCGVPQFAPEIEAFKRPLTHPNLPGSGRTVTTAGDLSILPAIFMLDATLTPGRAADDHVECDDQLLDHMSRMRMATHSGSAP